MNGHMQLELETPPGKSEVWGRYEITEILRVVAYAMCMVASP